VLRILKIGAIFRLIIDQFKVDKSLSPFSTASTLNSAAFEATPVLRQQNGWRVTRPLQ
jgi:hypothetical protein